MITWDLNRHWRVGGLPQPGSNRGYRPEQLIIQSLLSVWCGANRFEHGEVTRHDPVLKRLFGFTRLVNFKAIMKLFGKFTQSINESIMDVLYRWLFGLIEITGLTLDLDSMVMTGLLTNTVIEDLDLFGDFALRLFAGGETPVMYQFSFQSPSETFHRRVVQTVSFADQCHAAEPRQSRRVLPLLQNPLGS